MWILSHLPEYLIHTIFTIGIVGVIAGFVLSFIPFINAYKFPIQVISILILTLGVYFEGILSNKKAYELKIKDLEVKIAKAEAEASKKNVEIQEKIVEKTKVIREKGEKQIELITKIEKGEPIVIEKDISETERKRLLQQIEELKKFNETCTVPALIIDQHNKAATKAEDKKK